MPHTDAPIDYDPFQRARICNLTNACAIAQQITESTGRGTLIVATGSHFQPYRVHYADARPAEGRVEAEYRAA